MRDIAGPATTVAHPEVERKQGRGHIGLVVLGSITGGLISWVVPGHLTATPPN
jgi:hypothetical protein